MLSFPFSIRFLLAFDPALCAAVRRIFVRAVLVWYERRARRDGVASPHGGAVVVAQRFGGAVNLNLHFHALVLDGVFSCARSFTRPVFHPAPPLDDADVEQLTGTLARRVTRYLRRRGRLQREGEGEGEHADAAEIDEPLFAELCAASVQGRAAVPTPRSPAVARLGRRRERQASFVPGTLCCEVDSFSLHAHVLVPEERREQLEHLCRYVTRPPIATQRLSLSPDGRVVYGLKRHWRDGTSAVSFDPLTFVERLASLVPRPRCHLLTYHGILAPAAAWRDDVVPAGRVCAERLRSSIHSASRRATWAELLQRVFAIDALTCPHCGGKRKLIALITERAVVRKILAHRGLPTEPPALAPARAPPQPGLAFDA